MSKNFIIIPGQLNLDSIKLLLNDHSHCAIADSALPLINASCEMVKKVIHEKRTVYGINTGFGSLAGERISKKKLQQLQKNLILSHACGTGRFIIR